MRVSAYIDGFNLYHAVERHGQPHHRWLDLVKLCGRFVPAKTAVLSEVNYFSAYAHWKPEQMSRHRVYVSALESRGVKVHLSRFSDKRRRCPDCGYSWVGHEEKETDVKLAVRLLRDTALDVFDRCIILSRDSDLIPAAAVTKELYPDKEVFALAPPSAGHSVEMLKYVEGKGKIKVRHLEECLLPQSIIGIDGEEIVRPERYDPAPA